MQRMALVSDGDIIVFVFFSRSLKVMYSRAFQSVAYLSSIMVTSRSGAFKGGLKQVPVTCMG